MTAKTKNTVLLLVNLGILGLALYAEPIKNTAPESTVKLDSTQKNETNKMQKTTVQIPKKTLVGITARTNNATEANWESGSAKIFPCVQRYFKDQLAGKIQNRTNPGVTLCAYTDYVSDHTGDYTYFIGEEVSKIEKDSLPSGFVSIEVPAQTYVKLTTSPGDMPDVLRNAWFEIWEMDTKSLGGQRSYRVDFELYDERAATPDHRGIVLDIFIGIDQ